MTKSIRLLLSFALLGCLAAALLPAGALAAFGPVSSFGTAGSGAGQFKAPGKLDIAPDGSVYLADEGNNRIDVFTAKGQFAFAFGKGVNPSGTGNPDVCTAQTGCVAGAGSSVAGAIQGPDDVAITQKGEVDVSDPFNNRVDVFSAQGQFKYAFGLRVNVQDASDICTADAGCRAGTASEAAGSVRTPFGIGVDRVGGPGTEQVYIVGPNNRVDAFSQSGAFLFASGKGVNVTTAEDVCSAVSGCKAGGASSVAGGLIGPIDVTTNAQGEVLVSDAGNFRVDSYDHAGAFRSAFGASVRPSGGGTCTAASGCQRGVPGTDAGQIARATALALDPNGSIYIATEAERVDDFGVDGVFIQAFGAGVVNGQNAFQVCTEESGCRIGLKGTAPAATGTPTGVAVGASGTVYVAEADQNRIERFGEPEPMVPGTGGSTKPAPSPTPAPVKRAAGTLRLGKLKLDRAAGTATLTVAVSGAGTVRVTGKGLLRSQLNTKAAGNVKLAIKLGGKAKLALAQTGKAKVRAVVTFLPSDSAPLSVRRNVVLLEAPGS